MSGKQQFTPQERAPYMAYFDDGLWDILLALFLLVAGLSFLSDQFYILVILLLLAAPFMWQVKKRVTVPRLAPLSYSPAQMVADERRKHIMLEAATAVLFMGILLFTAVMTDPHLVAWFWPISSFSLGSFLALGVGLVGYLYRALNWAVYAFLLMVFTFASVGFGLSFTWCMLLAGALILGAALARLSHFLHQHPPLAIMLFL